jgi:vacuolar-type H+-ATPase subunit B/Vma2
MYVKDGTKQPREVIDSHRDSAMLSAFMGNEKADTKRTTVKISS